MSTAIYLIYKLFVVFLKNSTSGSEGRADVHDAELIVLGDEHGCLLPARPWHIMSCMREFLIAAAMIAALVVMALLFLIQWESLFYWGSVLVAAGMIVGVPTGFVYHVQLYKALHRKDRLARGWIWKPFEHHVHLDRRDRLAVMPWAIVGGLGFFIVVIGQVLVAAAIINAYVAR
jgi:hypothetical protein